MVGAEEVMLKLLRFLENIFYILGYHFGNWADMNDPSIRWLSEDDS